MIFLPDKTRVSVVTAGSRLSGIESSIFHEGNYMKIRKLEVREEDYTLLKELVHELQTQENDSQAFPYFWGPRSKQESLGTSDDTPMVYDTESAESYTLEGYAECNEEVFSIFLSNNDLPQDTEYGDIDEDDWQSWVESYPHVYITYSRMEYVSENNFSLFKSDVKQHIKTNSHHLGDNPHTYARTVWRMPKMEKLIQAIYRLFPAEEEEVNEEARRYVFAR